MKTSPRHLKRLREELALLRGDPTTERTALRSALESFFSDQSRLTAEERTTLITFLTSDE